MLRGIKINIHDTFEENIGEIFTQGKTKNYMDYSRIKKATWQWQWAKLHQSKFTQ